MIDWISQLALAFHFLNNAALLAVGSLGYCELRRHTEERLSHWARSLLYGTAFGLLGVLTSLAPAISVGGYTPSLFLSIVIVSTFSGGIASGATTTLIVMTGVDFMEGSGSAAERSLITLIPFACAVAHWQLVGIGDAKPRPIDFGIVASITVVSILGTITGFHGYSTLRAILPDVPAWAGMFVLTAVILGAIIRHVERGYTFARLITEQERRFRGFYNESPVILTAVDHHGRIAAVSDRWLEVMGYSREEVIGRSRYEFLAPASAAHVRDRVLPALQEDQPLAELALQLRRKDGTLVDATATSVLRRDPVTGAEEVLTFAVDQTARRRAEAALRESQELLVEAQHLGRVGHIFADRIAKRVRWSKSLFEIRRVRWRESFSFEEAIAFIHPDDRLHYEMARDAAIAAHRDFEIEVRILRGDGSFGWEHSIGRPRFAADGTLTSILVVLRDITESKLAEEALRRKEAELRAIMDNAPMTIFLKDREGRYLLVNRTYCEWAGRSPEEIYGRTSADLFPPEIARAMAARDKSVLERGEVAIAEVSTQLGDRRFAIEHALVTKFPVRDAAGAIVGLAGFTADITARRRAETALREAQRQLQALMDNAPFAIFLKNREGRFQLINRTYTDWFGDRPEDVVGRTAAEVYPREVAQQWEADDRQLMRTGRVFREERRVFKTRPSIEIEYVMTTKFPIRDEHGMTVGSAGISEDITVRKHAQDALRQSEERFRALIEHSNDMVIVITREGRITYRSPSAAEVTGRSEAEVVGQSIFDFVHPDEGDALRSAVMPLAGKPGARATGRTRVRHRDGSWRNLAWSARDASDVPGVEGVIINSRDVTQAIQLEEQLRESQKMEAVGQLAGGIAHDFNNILGAILGFAGFLLQDLPKDAPEHDFAQRIITAADRGKEIVGQIMTFSRRSTAERRPIDLVRIARETRDLLLATLPASTRLQLTVDDQGLVANANAAQITQILLNLCLNANDALRGEPGVIAIRLSRSVDNDPALIQASTRPRSAETQSGLGRVVTGTLRPGCAYARIAVADTGVGMSADVLKHIFDPFFTTKARGSGTGLGLSVVHGIIMEYGGALLVTSRSDWGSVFDVYLPLAEHSTEAIGREVNPAELRGRERVLVVDDEVAATEVQSIGLGRLGYEVVGVNNSEEAIEAVAEDPAAWDVVVSDEVMPRMNGLTLFRRLKEISPTLRFVLCTGFGGGTTEETALAAGVDAFFVKPVSPEEIAGAIRSLMREPASTSRPGGAFHSGPDGRRDEIKV